MSLAYKSPDVVKRRQIRVSKLVGFRSICCICPVVFMGLSVVISLLGFNPYWASAVININLLDGKKKKKKILKACICARFPENDQ